MMEMRKECVACNCKNGKIVTRSGQDCVFCERCNRYQYNAPKTETGRSKRSLSTTHAAIKPSQRSRIIERAQLRCERCGKSCFSEADGLHVGHILSVESGHAQGLSDDIINCDDNLIAECAECNGHGKQCLPVRLLVALLHARGCCGQD